MPERRPRAEPLPAPTLHELEPLLKSSGERELSTTMAFVRLLGLLAAQQGASPTASCRSCPDEARTFGMEGLFRQLGIYASQGQLYEPVDQDQVMYYREDQKGQILEEGINEAGAISSFIAAGTAYANYGINMIPFYAFYSMFGFQRVGDLIWAAADNQARGFLIGATSGRTTLAGEGLQHCDGQSQLLAPHGAELHRVRPDVCLRARGDRAGRHAPHVHRAGERLLLHHGHQRELRDARDAGGRASRASCAACTCCARAGAEARRPRVQLLGSGTILREVLAAAELLAAGLRRATPTCGA